MKSSDHLRLRVLGPASLDVPGGDPACVLSQPKRLAILAYLAVQGGFVRRDVLVTLFWPDLDAERARRALSQAIHYLRRALGKDVIRNRGVEEVGISPDRIWSDVREFEAAIAGSRWEEAVELYRGELLEGLNVGHTAEFAHWLDGARTRLRRSAGEAAAALSAAYFRDGDLEAAIRWQRRATGIRPLDEAGLRDFLMLLDEAGNGALALAEFESFRARLAEEYHLEPSLETVRLIGMIRSRRPDAVTAAKPAPVRTGAVAESESGGQGGAAVHPVIMVRQRRRRWFIAPATIGVIAVLLMTIVPLFDSGGGAAPVVIPNRVAVLHFETTEGDSLDYLALGLTTALTDYLHGFETLDVVPNHAVARFRYWDAPRDTIRSALRTRFILSGTLSRIGPVLAVTIELSNAVTQTTLVHRTVPFTGIDGRAIIDSVLVVAAEELAPEIGAELDRYRYEWGTGSEEATDYALRAAGLVDQAEEYARDDELDFAMKSLDQADSAVDRAIRHDRSWAQPHMLRTRIAWIRAFMCFELGCDLDPLFKDAVAHAEMAVNLEPDNAEALEQRADIVWKTWMVGSERDTAALNRAYRDAERAVLLDDSRALAWSIQSAIAHEHGDYELALKRGQTALDKDEFAADRNRILDDVFDAAFNLGDDSTAADVCESLRRSIMTLRAASCALQLRAWSERFDANVDEAWSIVQSLEKATAGASWEANRPTANLLVAAVIARAAQEDPMLADSARHVIERETEVSAEGNSLLLAAAAYTRAGAEDEARSLLRQYVMANPNSIGYVSGLRWFKPLDPDGTGVNLNVIREDMTASVFPKGPPHR